MAPLMALFPPGKGGGAGVAHGGKGKGILIHSLTDGGGMPLANRTTPANGDERAQVLPLLDAVKIRTGKRGRPRKRLKVVATDKGYDAKALRQQLRKRGIRAQIPKRVWKTKKNRGRPIKKVVPRFQAERTFAWFLGKSLPDREQAVRLFQEYVALIEPQRQLDPTEESERLDARATLFPGDPGAVKGGLLLSETPGLYDGRISRAIARQLSRRTNDMPQYESGLDELQLVV